MGLRPLLKNCHCKDKQTFTKSQEKSCIFANFEQTYKAACSYRRSVTAHLKKRYFVDNPVIVNYREWLRF